MTGNYNFETGSMTSILEQLGWETLHKRRKGSKLILLFKDLKGRASIHCDDLQPPNRRSNSIQWHFKCHMLELTFISTVSFQTTLGIGMHSPASIISSAESSEDPVARFTSLVRSKRLVFAVVGPGE